MDINKVLNKLDQLFAEAKVDEIEPFLRSAYEEAAGEGDAASMLSIVNELIGFTRETCQYDKLVSYAQDALTIVKNAGLEGSFAHGTTMLNIANGLRAAGNLEQSLRFYEQVEVVYKNVLSDNDFGFADLNNNISLLYQEMGEYEKARDCLLKALKIAKCYDDRKWEVAVTYSNLANTELQLRKKSKMQEDRFKDKPVSERMAKDSSIVNDNALSEVTLYAAKAIHYFRSANSMDTHYSAALTALGQVFELKGEYEKAICCYEEGKDAILKTLGHTEFYDRLSEYENQAKEQCAKCKHNHDANTKKNTSNETATLDDCLMFVDEVLKQAEEAEVTNEMQIGIKEKERFQFDQNDLPSKKNEKHSDAAENGLSICKRYFEQVAEPIFKEKFAAIYSQLTFGLVGEGSDCFGFDDAISRDHDWGPGFCIFVEDELYDADSCNTGLSVGEALQNVYENLPDTFEGYTRLTMEQGSHRIGVHKIREFYQTFLGESGYQEWKEQGRLSLQTELSIPSERLAAACNGVLFVTGDNSFVTIREQLKQGYSKEAKAVLLAQHCALFSQNAQYNYSRMKERHDYVSAQMMLSDGMKEALTIGYLLNNSYAPHAKWLFKGAKAFHKCTELSQRVEQILERDKITAMSETINRASAFAGNQNEGSSNQTPRSAESSRNQQEKSNASVGMEVVNKEQVAMNNYQIKDVGMSTEQLIEQLAESILEELLAQGLVGNAELLTVNGQTYMDTYLEHYAKELYLRSQLLTKSHDELVEDIAKMEFKAFDQVINEGGRAGCQDDWYTFHIMRTSQYTTWTDEMLMQYTVEFQLALARGWNMIMEKYGRMEESTVPEEWEKIKDQFPVIPERKKAIIEQIVGIQIGWMEDFAKQYPGMASNARNIHTSDDKPWDTSYETYLRGELGTYSDKMLQLYGQFIVGKVQSGQNLAYEIMEATVHQYGYESLDAAAKRNETLFM